MLKRHEERCYQVFFFYVFILNVAGKFEVNGVFVLVWGHFSYFPLVLYFPIFTIFYKNFIFFMSTSQYLVVED